MDIRMFSRLSCLEFEKPSNDSHEQSLQVILRQQKTAVMVPIPRGVNPMASTSLLGLRQASDMLEQHATVTKEKRTSHQYQQNTRKSNGQENTLADVVSSLSRRDSDEHAISRVSDTDYASLLEWIRCERMKKLPPEGSSFDKALVWAALFVERVHSFDSEIEQFAGDSHLAAQLSYGYCASLLEVRPR